MKYKQQKGNNATNAIKYDEHGVLTALYGQLTSIKKTIDAIALNRENESLSIWLTGESVS